MQRGTRRWTTAGLLVLAGTVAVTWAGCRRSSPQQEVTVPAPRYPRYLVGTTVEALMDAARIAVRQPYGRAPLGKIQSGQTVHVLVTYGQDPRVWEAIRRAWEERGVTARAVGSWEMMGITKEEYEARVKENLLHGNEAWQEIGVFRPQYQPFFPEAVQATFKKALTSEVVRKDIAGFLDRRPDIERFFAGTGGGVFWARAAGERHAPKFVGNWIYVTAMELLGKASQFPGDVWNMVDDKVVKPIPHVAEGTITDPEGTRLRWTVPPEARKLWGKQSGSNNHLNIYPPPERVTWQEGIIRASANHTGFYPTMTVTLDAHGRVERIDGGGRTGELFRMLVEHPKMRNAKFPSAPESGYWFFSQDGFATNPKFVRDVELLVDGSPNVGNLSERNRAGVQHFSFSHPASLEDARDVAYARSEGLPLDHTAHMHVYFPTVRWKMADTGEWITIAENGNVNAFNDPEVRALAARYGDPALVFRYEWIPGVPGVNVPGGHDRDYGSDPWAWIMKEWQQIKSGSYAYYMDDYRLNSTAQPPPPTTTPDSSRE